MFVLLLVEIRPAHPTERVRGEIKLSLQYHRGALTVMVSRSELRHLSSQHIAYETDNWYLPLDIVPPAITPLKRSRVYSLQLRHMLHAATVTLLTGFFRSVLDDGRCAAFRFGGLLICLGDYRATGRTLRILLFDITVRSCFVLLLDTSCTVAAIYDQRPGTEHICESVSEARS